jgi:hypothetical protein
MFTKIDIMDPPNTACVHNAGIRPGSWYAFSLKKFSNVFCTLTKTGILWPRNSAACFSMAGERLQNIACFLPLKRRDVTLHKYLSQAPCYDVCLHMNFSAS